MHHNYVFYMEDSNGELIVKGEIEGKSEVPFYDDLKLKGVIALLNSTDQQNFNKSGNHLLFQQYMKEIEETIMELKKYNEFQGKSDCRDGL